MKNISLGRGVPPNSLINWPLLQLVDANFSIAYGGGKATYSGNAVDGDPNAFRGDAQYIEYVLQTWRDEHDVDLSVKNILVGSNGGEDLTTHLLDLFHGRTAFCSPGLTFNRVPEHLVTYWGDDFEPIQETSMGFDLDKFTHLAKLHSADSLCFYIVWPGANPSGITYPIQNLLEICLLFQKNGWRIILDAAYWSLAHNEDDVITDFEEFEEFIKDGTLFIIRSSTKEGGSRGAAYILGEENILKRLLSRFSNRRLSPIYDLQLKQLMLETCPQQLIQWLGKGKEILTSQQFLELVIRPQLKSCFEVIYSILTPAGVEIFGGKVTHGYNCSVLLPKKTSKPDSIVFFENLMHNGVISGDLTPFVVGYFNREGFRFPFGGYSVDECRKASEIVVATFKQMF